MGFTSMVKTRMNEWTDNLMDLHNTDMPYRMRPSKMPEVCCLYRDEHGFGKGVGGLDKGCDGMVERISTHG